MFKVGDKVVVEKIIYTGNNSKSNSLESLVGKEGTITYITDVNSEYPYKVEFAEGKNNFFRESELKLSETIYVDEEYFLKIGDLFVAKVGGLGLELVPKERKSKTVKYTELEDAIEAYKKVKDMGMEPTLHKIVTTVTKTEEQVK